ncbi:MAG: protein translocase subunit SecD [Alphaproteobacteria bacterium]
MLRISLWQTLVILGIVVLGAAFAAPNLFSKQDLADAPGWLPNKQVALGLDLQGGVHFLLEVDLATAHSERMESLEDAVRAAFNDAEPRIGYTGLSAGREAVSVTLRDPATDRDRAVDALTTLDSALTVTFDEAGAGRITYGEDARAELDKLTIDRAIEVVRRRVDELGVRESTVQSQGDDRIIVEVPGVDDPQEILDIIEKTGRMTFHLVNTAVSPNEARPPSDTIIVPDQNGTTMWPIFRQIVTNGADVEHAAPQFTTDQGWVVSFRFNTKGARDFARVTNEHVDEYLAIVLDGEVISAPKIDEPITGGSGIIRGSFSAESATTLAVLLRAGALPAPLKVLEQRSVGPGLGQDSIDAGVLACVIGMGAVVVFMVMAYGLFGVFANVALVANLVLLMAILSALGATLTLPGIAGIVLTVGMAVDANVLIYERIREEVATGRSPLNACEIGFRRAITTIVDANLTTLIAAAILFQFGSGPIKGFAVTLAIGILTSMFTAIMVTRLQVATWLRRRRPQALAL